MKISSKYKKALKKDIVNCLITEQEIIKIVVFGSFVNSDSPDDIDVAIYQDSNDSYLKLAMKYRKLIRSISQKIPIDIIPLKANVHDNIFLSEIEAGEIIYER
ncbi:nucleotidyltransferase domain-containing protein [candidate division KSB1 bacterium]|nr:nucleotidyltransferase domain-containing protein [candidate division KSB1 bacterium]